MDKRQIYTLDWWPVHCRAIFIPQLNTEQQRSYSSSPFSVVQLITMLYLLWCLWCWKLLFGWWYYSGNWNQLYYSSRASFSFLKMFVFLLLFVHPLCLDFEWDSYEGMTQQQCRVTAFLHCSSQKQGNSLRFVFHAWVGYSLVKERIKTTTKEKLLVWKDSRLPFLVLLLLNVMLEGEELDWVWFQQGSRIYLYAALIFCWIYFKFKQVWI